MADIQVNLHEAKANLSRLIAAALQGDKVVIAKAGKPVVRLVPIPPVKPRKPGVLAGRYTVPESFFDPTTAEELADWES